MAINFEDTGSTPAGTNDPSGFFGGGVAPLSIDTNEDARGFYGAVAESISAPQAALRAEAAAEASATSATASEDSRQSANRSEANAKSSETHASDSANQAANSASGASVSAANALSDANRAKVEADRTAGLVDTKVNRAGDTMQGDFVLNRTPNANDTALIAATKEYVDLLRPENPLEYLGLHDASTTAYPVVTGITVPSYWIISVAGTIVARNPGNPTPVAYEVGDQMIYDSDSDAFLQVSATDIVYSVNGKQGDVTLNASEVGAIEKLSGDTGSAKIPAGTTAQRPADVDAQLRFNSNLNGFEGYNPSTSEWGGIGGGGVPEYIYQNADFTAEAKKAYAVDMAGNVNHVVTIPDGLVNGDWIVIKTLNWTGAETFYTVKTLADEWEVVRDVTDSTSRTLRISQNASVNLSKINGKWSVVDGIGEDGSTADLKELIAKVDKNTADIAAYPTPWVDIGSNLVPPAVAGTGELRARWDDKDSYRVSGIIRGATHGLNVLTLPGYARDGTLYSPGTTSSTVAGYVQVHPNTNQLQIQAAGTAYLICDALLQIRD